MTPPGGEQPFFLWTMFLQLRRRGFMIGPEDYEAVRTAVRAGFGLASRAELCEVVVALWAKSREETAVVTALFDQHVVSQWKLDTSEDPAAPTGSDAVVTEEPIPASAERPDVPASPGAAGPAPATAEMGLLPSLRDTEVPPLPYEHVFLPQYPVNFRTVAQAWRRLRWPVREGPATELDVEATVRRRSSEGVASPPVLRPRHRNRAKLLLLVDRNGSMSPFHSYVDNVCEAIGQAGRLRQVGTFYFHDVPLEGADSSILASLDGELFPPLDPILADIPALTDGMLMRDRSLTFPVSAPEVMSEYGERAAVVILSDGGAARGRYDALRLLDTIAFLKGVRRWTPRLVWLNPLPATAWAGSTAGQIARHVAMFPMDRDGMHHAVNVLRGQPPTLERPLTGLVLTP